MSLKYNSYYVFRNLHSECAIKYKSSAMFWRDTIDSLLESQGIKIIEIILRNTPPKILPYISLFPLQRHICETGNVNLAMLYSSLLKNHHNEYDYYIAHAKRQKTFIERKNYLNLGFHLTKRDFIYHLHNKSIRFFKKIIQSGYYEHDILCAACSGPKITQKIKLFLANFINVPKYVYDSAIFSLVIRGHYDALKILVGHPDTTMSRTVFENLFETTERIGNHSKFMDFLKKHRIKTTI